MRWIVTRFGEVEHKELVSCCRKQKTFLHGLAKEAIHEYALEAPMTEPERVPLLRAPSIQPDPQCAAQKTFSGLSSSMMIALPHCAQYHAAESFGSMPGTSAHLVFERKRRGS